MSVKNIFLSFIGFIALISSISTKKENGLFDPFSFLSEQQKLISLSTDGKLINVKCLYSEDYNMFSLQALQDKERDYETKDEDGKKVYYNFCQNTHKSDTATIVKMDENKIIRLAGSIEGEGDDKNVWSQVGTKENPTGLAITLVPGDECKSGARHQTVIKVNCDPEVDKIDNIDFTSSNGGCTHTLEFDSLYGCTLRSTYLFLRLLQDYKIIFCIIFILLGLIICFFGHRYLKYAIVIICGLVVCYAAITALLNFFPNLITSEIVLIIALIVLFVLGCAVGFWIKNMTKLIVVLLGGFLGFCCAKFLYQIVQNYVEFNPTYLYYICIAVCVIIGALLGYFLSDLIIIIATAVFGAYLIMRGISLVAGHYLDEGYIIDLIKSQEWEQLKSIRDGWTYAYLGVWVVLSLVGIVVQCKTKRQLKSDDI